MKYIAAETYGLADFRGITQPAASIEEACRLADVSLSTPGNPCYGFWGEDGGEIYPGEWLDVGKWMYVQDGLVYGRFATKAEAEEDDPDLGYTGGRTKVGSGPFYIGQIVKILRRHNGCGATQVVLAV
jgi:hypothetical protein